MAQFDPQPKGGRLYDAAPCARLPNWSVLCPSAKPGVGTEYKIPDRGSDDRKHSSVNPTRRIDSDAHRPALSEPHQGVQRDMRQPAGRDPRRGTDHAYQERTATQCPDHFEFETGEKRSVGI